MKLLIFSVAVAVMVLGCAVALAWIDACGLGNADPKFGCLSGLQVVAAFALVGAGLSAMAAGVARALLRAYVPLDTLGQELGAAALSSVVLVVLFDGVIRWEADIGGIAGIVFGWLFASFVICGASLIVVGRLVRGGRGGRP